MGNDSSVCFSSSNASIGRKRQNNPFYPASRKPDKSISMCVFDKAPQLAPADYHDHIKRLYFQKKYEKSFTRRVASPVQSICNFSVTMDPGIIILSKQLAVQLAEN